MLLVVAVHEAEVGQRRRHASGVRHVLAELEPDFIKLNHMLVRGLPGEPIKRNLVSAITGFAGTSRSVIIAEGVEREDEMRTLVDLGVMLQQGFFFGRPQKF